MMKTITLAVTAMLSLTVLTMTAMSQSQTSDTAYEKKSYNYAEWAGGALFSPFWLSRIENAFDTGK